MTSRYFQCTTCTMVIRKQWVCHNLQHRCQSDWLAIDPESPFHMDCLEAENECGNCGWLYLLPEAIKSKCPNCRTAREHLKIELSLR